MRPLRCDILLGPECPTSKRTQRTAFSSGSWDETEKERGLNTDKGEGLHGFFYHLFLLFKSLVQVTLWGPREEGPGIDTRAVRERCAIQVLSYKTWIYSWEHFVFTNEKTVCACSLLSCSGGESVKRLLRLTGGGAEPWQRWLVNRGQLNVLKQAGLNSKSETTVGQER